LYHKWFEIYADRTIPRYDIKKILFWVLTPVVVILGVILLWSASLRRLVRKRTRELQEQNRELQRAKEEILSREKELHLLVASLDDIAMEFDRDGRYMNIWTADDSVLFLPRDQLIGKTIREIFGRDFAQPFETVIPNVLDTGVPDNVDYNVPLDGEVRWFNARISPIEGDTAKRDRVVMLIRDITGKKVIEDALQYSLKEKDVLLKEIHHRVKNNLQIVSSLLSLQISRITEPSVISALEESKNRVRAMAIIHEILYNSDKIGELNFSKYTASLLNNLIATFNRGQVKVSTDIDDIALGLNDAIPCGLIINELVTNSLKHAFEHVDDPAISVSMKNGGPDKSIMLTVQDNGKGIPESFNPEDPDTLGMRLVFSLAQQIGGEVSYSFTEGTRFTITFPLRERGDVL
ncbi:MAG TPA: histidine kinase dimerization/phosphoacceptor domain -containing protein, partial [Spirochaetota bacterium]|nr:histidine kinase dimerization/phosphoacceptor domain -containing protein [Spirochaetota bacterium]